MPGRISSLPSRLSQFLSQPANHTLGVRMNTTTTGTPSRGSLLAFGAVSAIVVGMPAAVIAYGLHGARDNEDRFCALATPKKVTQP